MAELHWFPAYAADWLGSPAISMMLPEQEGAYWRLLNLAWGKGDVEPSLPDDAKALAQMSRLGSRWKRLGALVREQFVARGGRLYNEKLSAVWLEQQAKHGVAVKRASAGGRAKAQKGRAPSTASSTPEALPDACLASANSESELETETTIVDDYATVDGSVIGEPVLTAMYLTIYANGAITERWGEQPSPLTAPQAHSLAEYLQGIGADPLAVKESIYRQCRESKQPRPPRGVNYFRQGIEDDLAKLAAKAALRSSGDRPPPPMTPRASKPNAGAQMFANIMGGQRD